MHHCISVATNVYLRFTIYPCPVINLEPNIICVNLPAVLNDMQRLAILQYLWHGLTFAKWEFPLGCDENLWCFRKEGHAWLCIWTNDRVLYARICTGIQRSHQIFQYFKGLRPLQSACMTLGLAGGCGRVWDSVMRGLFRCGTVLSESEIIMWRGSRHRSVVNLAIYFLCK